MESTQILVIDDEKALRDIIRRALKREKFELIFAENGRQGIEALRANHPTLIILDLRMPEMDGFSFLQEVGFKPEDPYAVIVLTGHGDEDDMQKCYDLGAQLFLRKPFGYTEFLCQVHRLVRLKKLEAEARAHREYLERSVQEKTAYIGKLSRALECSTSIITMTNAHGTLTYRNKAFLERFGDLLSTQNQDSVIRLFQEAGIAQNAVDDLWNTIASDKTWRGELVQNPGEDVQLSYNTTAFPVKDRQGVIDNYFFIMDDISELKVAEQEKAKARQALEEADQMKECFSNNISHELMTPLHVISTSAALIDESPDPDDARKYLDFIKKSANDLYSIITKILDYKLVKENTLEIHHERFDLPKTMEEIWQEQRVSAEQKGVDLTLSVDTNLPTWFLGDELRLNQIITYLLNNAIKFTQRGEISLKAALAPMQPGDGVRLIRFTVRDTGIGIAADKQDIIYDHFRQADETVTRSHGGIGLGLTMVHYLVESFNGTITLDSQEGEGSTFEVIIPLQLALT